MKDKSLRNIIIPLVGQFIEKNVDLALAPLSKDASPPIRDLHAVTRRIWLAYVIGCQDMLAVTCAPLLSSALKVLDEEEKAEAVKAKLRVERFNTIADLAIYYVESTRIWNAASEMALLEKMTEHEADIVASGDAMKDLVGGAVRGMRLVKLVRSSAAARKGQLAGGGIMDAVVSAIFGGSDLFGKLKLDDADDCTCSACQLRRKIERGEDIPDTEDQVAAILSEKSGLDAVIAAAKAEKYGGDRAPKGDGDGLVS